MQNAFNENFNTAREVSFWMRRGSPRWLRLALSCDIDLCGRLFRNRSGAQFRWGCASPAGSTISSHPAQIWQTEHEFRLWSR